jgi:uncharacterized membrane protein
MAGGSSHKVSRHYIETTASQRRFALMRRAFDEFMALPTAIFVGAIVLAFITLNLDAARTSELQAGKQFILGYMFRSEQGTHDFLTTLLAGLLTLISITFSILLLAVQQTASSLSNQVYDQFLRRTANQIFLGYAVGLAVYTLIVLATVGKGFNPIYSACTIVVFTTTGLGLLIILIYGTIYQMRPVVIIEAMHDHILRARERQKNLVNCTRRESQCQDKVRAEIRVKSSGFFQDLRVENLSKACDRGSEVEIVVLHAIGTYLAHDDTLAVIKASSAERADEIVPYAKKALVVESDRDLNCDPAWGIIELESVAWTTVSSAKSTPEPPRLVINALRDIFTRWADEEEKTITDKLGVLPVVYHDDVHGHVLNALATIAAGANESLQHVVMIEALKALRSLYTRVPAKFKPAIKDVIRRVVPALQPLIPTQELEQAIMSLAASMRESADRQTAGELAAAVEELVERVGRVPKNAA